MLPRWLVLALILSLSYAQNCYSGCLECDKTASVCSACHDGYSPTLAGGCTIPKVGFCSTYADQHTCATCLPTYRLIAGTCVRDYSGCILNPSASKCLKCMSGLALNMGACVGVLNCKSFSGKCTECSKGFSLVLGVCVAQPINCVAANPSNGVCLQCRKGYSSSGYSCISNANLLSNCDLQEDSSCLMCKQGYTNVEGFCYSKSEGQMLLPIQQNTSDLAESESKTGQGEVNNDTGQKSSAETATFKATDQSQNIASVPQTNTKPKSTSKSLQLILSKLNSYCKYFSLPNLCAVCYQGFYIISGYCFPIDPYCKSFNFSASTCGQCYKGYAPNSQGKCVIAPQPSKDANCKTFQGSDCLACYSSYHLKLGICIPNNPLCKQTALDGSCEDCFLGYILQQGDCVVDSNSSPNIFDPFCVVINGTDCVYCANGYYVGQNGTCVPLSLNCLSHSIDGSCLQCPSSYIMINDRCIQRIDNCMQYQTNGSCSACSSGYFVKQGLCYKLDVTCSVYDEEGECIQCIATYYLINRLCVYPSLGFDPLCEKYTNSFCVSCQKGSFLSNYRCRTINLDCIAFDQGKLRCTKCANGLSPYGIGCR